MTACIRKIQDQETGNQHQRGLSYMEYANERKSAVVSHQEVADLIHSRAFLCALHVLPVPPCLRFSLNAA